MTLGAIDDGTSALYKGSSKQKENLLKEYALKKCVKNGIYATYIKNMSGASFLGTRADYLGIRPGDNIYFFFNRCIYGIGEIVGIDGTCFRFSTQNSIISLPEKEKSGYGIANCRKRLELLYPDRYQLEITELGDCYRVTLILHLR